MANDLTRYQASVDQFFDTLPDESFEQVDCLWCGSRTRSALMFEKGTMKVHRCRCGFVWNARQPKEDTLEAFYKNSPAMSQWATIKTGDEKKQKEKFDRAINFLASNKVKSILDIGCGTGKFLELLKQQMPNAKELGIDTHQESLSVAQQAGLNVRLGALGDIEPSKYDAISLWGTLEHLKNPLDHLDQLVSQLLVLYFCCVSSNNS